MDLTAATHPGPGADHPPPALPPTTRDLDQAEVAGGHDDLRAHVAGRASDLLGRDLTSWLVPALVAGARDLRAAGVDLDPPEATGSLALAVLEAVWAPRVDAATTRRVVARFLAEHGPDAGASALVEAVRREGGDEAWARACATRHRVLPSVEAPLKATAAREAAQTLLDHGVSTTGDLLDLLRAARAVPDPAGQAPAEQNPVEQGPDALPAAEEASGPAPQVQAARARWDGARRAWCSVPGQAGGRSWHRLLVLAGADLVVPDDDVRRFVGRWDRRHRARRSDGAVPRESATGAAGSSASARPGGMLDVWVSARLLELAGELTGASPREVDHVVWRGEVVRGLPRRGPRAVVGDGPERAEDLSRDRDGAFGSRAAGNDQVGADAQGVGGP